MSGTSTRETVTADAGDSGGRTYLYGCLLLVGTLVILSAAGVWAAYRTADAVSSLTGGTTPTQVLELVEGLAAGLMNGSIRPETGIQMLCQLFADTRDGVLTTEEIWSILEQARDACGARL